MARKKSEPIITHTELLGLAYRALEQEVRQWQDRLSNAAHATEEDAANVEAICSVQLRQMEAIRQMYLFETGTEI